LLKEIEELLDETGDMAGFIELALRRYSVKLVVTGEPSRSEPYHDIHVDCAQRVLSKWSRRGDLVVDAIYDEDDEQLATAGRRFR
jgi:hypothetical protein